jgi:Putative sugar-binding domain
VAEPTIAEVLTRAQTDIAMVGIGAIGTGSSNEILDGLGPSAAERDAFLAAKPVGDTCCRFFDVQGKPIPGVVHDRVLAIELDQLKQIPTVIGVPHGRREGSGRSGRAPRRAHRRLDHRRESRARPAEQALQAVVPQRLGAKVPSVGHQVSLTSAGVARRERVR